MRDLHDHCKFKDIIKRKRDSEGKVIQNYSDILDILHQIERENENYSYAMFLPTNNLHPFIQKRQQIENLDREKENHFQNCIQKNRFHPYIWHIINQAA